MKFDEIIEYMLASVPSEYDTSVGSFFYDLLYPVAEQIYRLQGDITLLEQNAFALTAVGEYLDRKVAEQGITRKQATFAKGTVRISGDVGAVVQQGAKVASGDILFAVDEETDSELLERYLEKVSRPNVSGSKYHYIEWAKEVSGVGEVSVIPLWNGPGTVKVVIVDSLNQPATDDLITAVTEHIEKLRPIGANVTVVSAKALTVNISVSITNDVTEEMTENIKTAISNYLSGDAIKKSYISYAKIGGCILAVDGVDDYANLKVNSGTSNISIPAGSVPVLGSVVIT